MKRERPVLVQTAAEEKIYDQLKAIYEESKGLPVTSLGYLHKPQSAYSCCPRPDVVRHFVDALGITFHESPQGITYTVSDDRVIAGRLQDGKFLSGEKARRSHTCCKIEGKPVFCGVQDFMLVDKDGISVPYVCNSLIVHALVHHWDDLKENQVDLLNSYLAVVGIEPIH